MQTVIVIPSRYGSTRFPGKPLSPVAGVSLLERVYRIARSVSGVDAVFVATDDERIVQHVTDFGGQAIMTGECENGTERVWQAVEQLPQNPDIIINLQGDAVLTPPWVIQAVGDELRCNANVQLCTPAVRMDDTSYRKLQAAKAAGEVGGTTVTVNKNGDALYFSKAIIPYVRKASTPLPVLRHIGLYGYRYQALKQYLSLPPSMLELTEGLEQLRALENGIPIRVVEVNYTDPESGKLRSHWAVDTPEDAKRAEDIIANEGELLPCA